MLLLPVPSFGAEKTQICGKLPSPGSTWKRTQRRTGGWMGSGVRALLKNPLYKGVVTWNVSEWRKDPDSGKHTRIVRPASEWIRYHNEGLRIVADALWERAQRRARRHDDTRLKAGGKVRYLLSGLRAPQKSTVGRLPRVWTATNEPQPRRG